MMERISKLYSKVLEAVAVLLLIVGTIAGGIFGVGLEKTANTGLDSLAAAFIIGAIIGFLLSYMFVVVVFGFMAQVISINEKLSRIENLLDRNDDSVS